MLRPFTKFVFDTNKRLYEAPLLLVIEACKEMRLRLIHSGPTVRNRHPGIASVYQMCAKVPIRPCLGNREREIGRYRST
jgi:hypothetical protein